MPFAPSTMVLESAAFEHGQPIPERHSPAGENHSPALTWRNAPDNVASFAVFCHDPDAPLVSGNGTYGFVHWVIYNIPPSVHELPEAVSAYTSGRSNAGSDGYSGPKPPEGHGEHRYYFWIVALDTDRELAKGLTLWEFLKEAEPHIMGMSRLVGTHQID